MNLERRFVLVNADSVAGSDFNRKTTLEETPAVAHQIGEEEGCPSGLAETHGQAGEDRFEGTRD